MKFTVGDKVYCKTLGFGAVEKIDAKNKEFTYFCRFKKGTLIWVSEKFADKSMKLADVK